MHHSRVNYDCSLRHVIQQLNITVKLAVQVVSFVKNVAPGVTRGVNLAVTSRRRQHEISTPAESSAFSFVDEPAAFPVVRESGPLRGLP